MQTKFGYGLSLITIAIAAALAWTGKLTGWFDPENIVSPSWGYLALGTLLALGVVRLIDRRRWVVMMLGHKTEEAARRAQIQRRIAAVAGFWSQIKARSLDSIQESLGIGPYAPEVVSVEEQVPAASATG